VSAGASATPVTVLGASGRIGRRLVERLRAQGLDVRSAARDDPAIFDQPLGAVVYAIGLTADFRQRPFDTVEAHVSLLSRLLQRARFQTLVYLSSTRVYAASAHGREDRPLAVQPSDPSDLYNLSKLMGESVCLNSGNAGIRVARLSNVVGPVQAGSANFLDSLVSDALRGEVVMQSAPASAKDYLHLDDAVDLIGRMLQSGSHRLYNLASGEAIRHETWTQQLQQLTGCRVLWTPGAPVQSFPAIDIERIRQDFGFSPRSVLADFPHWLSQARAGQATATQEQRP
jgi:nucleoside-diphosphate-sugar epimerase